MSEVTLGSLSELQATGMLHPFQCLLFCTLTTEGSPSLLLAASRHRVFVFSAANGNLLSTWQTTQDQAVDPHPTNHFGETRQEPGLSEPPVKRRKKASSDNESDSSSAEIVTEDGHSRTRKSCKPKFTKPNVIKLIVTSDGQTVVAGTDEDKSVRVLQLDARGRLQQLSQRQDYYCPNVDLRLKQM